MVDRRLLRQIRRLAYPLSLAPLFAFLYCLAAAYQVAEVTVYTHCLVDNFAVSVSEAVSTPDTSLKIFTASIIVHVIPRFILILDLGRFYREHLPPNGDFHPGLWLFILSGAMEVVGLVGLTILPSHNHKTFQKHREFAVMFLIGSIAMMLLSCLLEKDVQDSVDKKQQKIIKKRLICAKMMAFTTAIMAYLYYRHNVYCEPYVYSAFCISEYVIFVINISYHVLGEILMVINDRRSIKGHKFQA